MAVQLSTESDFVPLWVAVASTGVLLVLGVKLVWEKIKRFKAA
jgi:hypothetical protein